MVSRDILQFNPTKTHRKLRAHHDSIPHATLFMLVTEAIVTMQKTHQSDLDSSYRGGHATRLYCFDPVAVRCGLVEFSQITQLA